MNTNKTLRFLLPALGAALLLSCTEKEPVPAGVNAGADDALTPVRVSLDLKLDGERNGTPKTRAIDDPGTVADTQIHNLCILQYNGTGDDAALVGEVHYLRDDVDADDENYLDMNQIKLADSQGAEHTLVILANTFRQLPRVETLGEMLALWRTVEGEPDVFGHEGQGEGFPDDAGYYQRLNALAVMVVENDAVVKGTLRRSMARINVEIVNDGTDGLQIRKVQLRTVSQKDYYITDYSYIDANDDVQTLRSTPFQDEYVPAVPMRADYAEKEWTGTNDGSVQSGEGTGTATYRWYVSSNMRGTDTNNTLPSQKNVCPNAAGATYLYILARYGSDADGDGLNDELIEYKFYLGENLVNNFDLCPNTSYSYRLTFNGKGNTSTDQRVNDMGSVNFPVDANCYIVNPPVEGSRKYTFNVIHRPHLFWGTPNGEDRYGLQTQYPNNWIPTTQTWKARILWSDVPYEMNDILTRKTGTGEGGYNDAAQRLELTIPSDVTEGNIVVGVWRDDPSNILWSWHIWITSYQPDDISGHAPDEGTYIYSVNGGEVHRYGGNAWTTGRYKDGYAMDRNLGALDDRYRTSRGGGFYYQFGRKDPFPANYTVYTYDYDGTRTQVSGDAVPKVAGSSTGQSWKNVPYSVNNPRTYITNNGYWTSGDVFNPSQYNSSIVWQDPYNGNRTEEEEVGTNATKSIFDPCPPGWRLPVNGTWAHFTGDGSGSSTTSTTATFQWGVVTFNGHDRGTGRTYYPLTFYASKSNPTDASIPTIFFPASGDRDSSNGAMGGAGSYGFYWGSSPGSATNGYDLYFNSGTVNPSRNVSRANGCPVRCVRESYQ